MTGNTFQRRGFLAAAASTGALGASDGVRLATIGAGGRGRYLTGQFKEHGAEMAAVCDVYEPNLQSGLRLASPGARGYVDYRRLLEDKTIDAVVIATPDHLHASMLIAAVEAGKDVYVEKPIAHTIEDGFRMVDAVRRTKRIVQVGTQRRSYELYQEAKGVLDSGVAGNIRLVTAHWLNSWDSLRTPPLKGKLDWDLFLGPAPKRPLDAVRFFNWLQFFDYSGGIMIGQAAHIVDGIHWMMNSTHPVAVTCAAGRSQPARRRDTRDKQHDRRVSRRTTCWSSRWAIRRCGTTSSTTRCSSSTAPRRDSISDASPGRFIRRAAMWTSRPAASGAALERSSRPAESTCAVSWNASAPGSSRSLPLRRASPQISFSAWRSPRCAAARG